MDGDDGSRVGCDVSFDLVGVYVECHGIDIHENRPHPVVEYDVGRGDERGGRDQHLGGGRVLVILRQGCQGDLQRGGAAVAKHAVLYLVNRGEIFFKPIGVFSFG